MNLKAIIIKVAIGLALTLAGWQLTDKGLSYPSEKDAAMYAQLCKNSVKTKGRISEDYTTTKIALKGTNGTNMNTFKYVYTVNGQDYNGQFTVNIVPSYKELDVWYDPNDPTVHFHRDPCKQVDYYKDKKYPRWFAFLGIPMLLIGAGMLYSMFKNGMRSLFTPAGRK
ncbi:hypothetical protein [Chitinophaga pinensis]|uniref:DUF3592 domain-containing protein n=1 Tax=Chitinophaga pinensis (strain ATCC 43595 / DSM 2588 / LMG 13176 / NBRC 15968 / NCIMB 11800 / UQM 2034) TaxID=485918 RepID=A0A979G3M5_CHIPD|nr:hypothetical protein [Chitinophaga pinensis]ACU59968.1 hypothetical protein Cpin_2480 [Chitinophaga pinensis DSM 2588]